MWEGEALKGAAVEGADLVLADGARFTLGEKQALSWVDSHRQSQGPDG